jgi:hypothetical protein
MQMMIDAIEAVLGVTVLILAPLVMLAFWNYVTGLGLMGGW